ncbi:MAG: YihY/virulence factor BrkB family protein [Methanolobus sp.]|uniref:YihY/virulence factor BrkB family protein n=1 Tax=Methanolobus sp. TaxID=1874737 RepID=UPI0027308D19|nr:YihY/virulence factor BrkB family protein [Methanolobus sp.]MDP2218368.1 YihY/virulence factor BrkB family protein [Methanolobus sp.]
MGKIKDIVIGTIHKWNNDDGFTDSAALSFIVLMSLPALLLFLLSVSSFFLREEAVQQSINDYVSSVGNGVSIHILDTLFRQIPETSTITLGLLVSFALFLWTSGNLFLQLQKTINRMWNVSYKSKTWYEELIKKRISAFIAVFIFVLLVVLITVFEVLFSKLSQYLDVFLPIPSWVIQYTSSLAIFLILVLLFIYFYRVLPETKMDYKYVITGSFLTVSLITLGKYIFSLYMDIIDPTRLYGSVGLLLATFLGIYISAIIVTVMVEFTKVYADYETAQRREQIQKSAND